jgi:hypothetical protein
MNRHETSLTNPAEVRQFLETLTTLAKAATEGIANPGLLQIGQVHPLDENGYVATRYRLDDVELMIKDAIAFSNAGHNVYIEGRTVRSGLGMGRGAVEDTVAVFALVADDDGDKGMAANALPITPTLQVESSPGNTHPWFVLTKAVTSDGGVKLGKALKAKLGGDPNTGTITQPYRVSGTVNYPTKKKLGRGRVAVPTKLLSTTQAYSIEEFNEAFPPPPPDCQSDKSDNNQEEPVDRFMAVEALSVLDDTNVGRERWVAIGCGLYKNFGEEVAREIFEGWSSHSPNYNQRTFRKQWRSFVKGKGYGYTIASLLYYADEADPRWRRRYETKWWREVGDEIAQRLFHPPVDDPDWNAKFFKLLEKQGDNDKPADVAVLVDTQPAAEAPLPPSDAVIDGPVVVEKPAAVDRPVSVSAKEPARSPQEQPTGAKQSKPPRQQPRRNGVVLVCAKDVIIKPKQWIWEGHLLRGAQELLSGLPGLGKSQAQISFVACVTAGLPWPNGDKAMSPANVIMLTAEDTLGQEVVPRLIAAGANLERVHILKCIKSDGKDRQFLLGEDLALLEGEVAEVGDVALITIDPITAYMGGKMDAHKTTEVRSQLGPLKDFAEKLNVAVSTITHPAKNTSQKAIDQFIGSQAFIAAGRIGHVCIEEVVGEGDDEKTKTGRIWFANAKNNPHTKMPTLAFRITEAIIGQDDNRTNIAAPHVVWDKDAVDITADQAVQAASGSGKKSEGTKQTEAFLKEILDGGKPVPVNDIHEQGKARGFSDDQIKRAKKKLGGINAVQASDRRWMWQRPM